MHVEMCTTPFVNYNEIFSNVDSPEMVLVVLGW